MIGTIATATTTMTANSTPVLGAVSLLVLIILLIAKELLSASKNNKTRLLAKNVDIVVNPLLFVFLCIVAIKVLEVLEVL